MIPDRLETSTLSLRPGVLFGPGRDAGLTASPTTAMKCLALGLPFEIPFRSRQDYQYAADVGGAVGSAVIEPFDGFGVFTLPGRTLDTQEMVDVLRRVAVGPLLDQAEAEDLRAELAENLPPEGAMLICQTYNDLLMVGIQRLSKLRSDWARRRIVYEHSKALDICPGGIDYHLASVLFLGAYL